MSGLDLWRSPGRGFGVFNELSRDFDRLFREMEALVTSPGEQQRSPMITPACDIEEVDGNYLMSFDLPGIDKSDIEIDISGNLLTVRARKSGEAREDGGNFHKVERFRGDYQRSFTLPQGVDPDAVEADYSNGVLRLVVPVSQEEGTRKVPIGKSEGGFLNKLLGRTQGNDKSATREEGKQSERAS